MSLLTRPRESSQAPRVLTRLQTEALAGAMSALAVLDEVMGDAPPSVRATALELDQILRYRGGAAGLLNESV